jgi:hypothetical protein
LALNKDVENQFAAAVKVAIEVSHTKGASKCPPSGVLTAYREHALSRAEHLRWQAHLAGCTLSDGACGDFMHAIAGRRAAA